MSSRSLYARGAPKIFGNFAIISFARVGHKFIASSRRWTPDFLDLDAMLTRSTLSDVVQCAQRTLAGCAQVSCAGRAGFPEFLQNFRPIFAQILRDLGAGLALYLALQRAPTQKRGAMKFFGLRNNAGRVHAIFLRAARRKFSGNLQFFSRELGAKFA